MLQRWCIRSGAFTQSLILRPRLRWQSSLSAIEWTAVQGFRRRAVVDLTTALETSSGTGVPVQLGEKLRTIASEEVTTALGETSSSQASVHCEQEATEVLDMLSVLEEFRKEKRQLQARRADLLAIGFQNSNEENQEFTSLIVCAVGGLFAVSIHYVFFVLWLAGYMVYRRSTRSVRQHYAAMDTLQDVTDRLKELEALESKRVAEMRSRLEAWRKGEAE